MAKDQNAKAATIRHPAAERLQAFAVGRVDADEASTIEAHVVDCDTCRLVLESAPDDGLLQLVQSASVEPLDPSTLRLAPGYDILDQLGRGGMGVVYRARQLALDRMVALKMIASEEASHDELARFRTEAEAAARLQHPNIVQVFDQGDLNGHPYLAMELIQGKSLEQHLANGPLTSKNAASLVETLARAVQFAHEQGIIHRDLKPANVLMATNVEADAPVASWETLTPKIADFGLAKRLDAAAAKTHTGVLVGTPSYMAPEQAAGSSGNIGPAVDQYALGAVLFRLITGRSPFLGATVLETLDQVVRCDPPRPSTLQPNVPHDLEVICLKCLEKEPHRRYPNAAQLADDLGRFLNSQPILARPTSAPQRAFKWAKRRPAIAALIAVSGIALIMLLIGGGIHNARLSAALAIAQEERDRADDNYSQSFDAVDRMLERVGFSELADIPEMEGIRQELLQDAVQLYAKLLRRQPENDDRLKRRRFHTALMRLGKMQNMLGNRDDAERSLLRAIDLQKEIRRQFPKDLELTHDLAVSHINLGLVRHDDRPQAIEQYDRAIRLLNPITSQLPDCRIHLALAISNLATRVTDVVYRERLHEDEFALRTALVSERPGEVGPKNELGQTLYNRAMLYLNTGRGQLAEADFRVAIEIWEPLTEKRPRIAHYQSALADCYASLGTWLVQSSRVSAGIEMLKKCIERRETLHTRYPMMEKHQTDLAKGFCTLGALQISTRQPGEAVATLQNGLRLHRTVAQKSSTAVHRSLVAETLTNLAMAFSQLQNATEAIAAYSEAIQLFEEIVQEQPAESRFRLMLGINCLNFSNTLRSAEPQQALSLNDQAVKLLAELSHELPKRSDIRSHLLNAYGTRAGTLGALERYTEAVADWDQVVKLADSAGRSKYRMMRLLLLPRVERKRAAEEANALAKDLTTQPADLYNLACVFALCAKHEMEDGSRGTAQREAESTAYADKAVTLLSDERLESFFSSAANVQHLQADPDLQALANHQGFRELVERLTASAR